MITPNKVTITGADDATDITDLAALSRGYPRAEWALLYFPEKMGGPRNPSTQWRNRFAESRRKYPFIQAALHLCGNQIYRDILEDVTLPEFVDELGRYDRVQVNINAREPVFSDDEIEQIYAFVQAHAKHVILQFHISTRSAIHNYLEKHPDLIQDGKVSVLLDASGGRGIAPGRWPSPLRAAGQPVPMGYAGGIGPNNIKEVAKQIAALVPSGAEFWLDMESNVRTDNQLDIPKVAAVLAAVP